MVQSSDRNDSKENRETGSMPAEQILDSIIEHIESTNEPENDSQQLPSGQHQNRANVPVCELQEESADPGTNADFKNIEKRAAELASKLGGTGLSYSAGVKKYLEQDVQPTTPSKSERKPVAALATAVIHQDDLDVDSKRFGLSELDEPGRDATGPNADDVNQQQNNVNKWDAELQDNKSMDEPKPGAPELADIEPGPQATSTRLPGEPLDASEERVAEVIDQPNNINETTSFAEHAQELQDIETNIEALSASMTKQVDHPSALEPAAEQVPSIVELAPTRILDSEMEQRVTSLEKHIVTLLDDVALSGQKMGDNVTQIVRTQSQLAVQEAIDASEVFGAMKAELAHAAEQRHLQDVRMSDSLDALHDALKDIGERVKTIETDGAAEPQAAEMSMASGIVASVLGSKRADTNDGQSQPSDKKMRVDDEVADLIAPDIIEELPVWLSDATQDLHVNEQGSPVESADVFASRTKQQDPVSRGPLLEHSQSETEIEDISPELDEPVNPEQHLKGSAPDNTASTDHKPGEGATVHEQQGVEQADQQGLGEAREELVQKPAIDKEFLRSARAAARAANERTNVVNSTNDAAGPGPNSVKKIGNFIAAAKQKDRGVESEPIVENIKNVPKNSLFTDKVQGPNSLLVFTSLILFGTSALLLYGMSRDDVDTGTVVKLNASEKLADQLPADPRLEGVLPAKIKSIEHKNAKPGAGGGRSTLQSGSGVALANKDAGSAPKDTPAKEGKTVITRTIVLPAEPSAIEFTAAIGGARGKVETGSLFDQYISFSSPSGSLGTLTKKSVKAVAAKTDQPNTGGTAGLLKSASRGDVLAQYEVARRFGKGIGVEKSAAISVEWYEKSAKAGYAPAIYRLATMYERGNGVAKDYQRAKDLYMSAAEKGNVKAMHNLAVLYTGGNLGRADFTNAITWYAKAAEYGVKDSQFNLAIIYQNGMGGKLDIEGAYKWYSLAARAGDKEAVAMVKDLRKDLSGKLLKKLDENIRTWKPRTPDESANVVSQYRKASLQDSQRTKS